MLLQHEGLMQEPLECMPSDETGSAESNMHFKGQDVAPFRPY